MFISKGFVIGGGIYFSLIMKTILKSLIISLGDYLVHQTTVNIFLITKDITIRREVIKRKMNQHQVKLNTRVTNIWKDIKVLLNYAVCFTVDPTFTYLFSNMIFNVSLSNMYLNKNT